MSNERTKPEKGDKERVEEIRKQEEETPGRAYVKASEYLQMVAQRDAERERAERAEGLLARILRVVVRHAAPHCSGRRDGKHVPETCGRCCIDRVRRIIEPDCGKWVADDLPEDFTLSVTTHGTRVLGEGE